MDDSPALTSYDYRQRLSPTGALVLEESGRFHEVAEARGGGTLRLYNGSSWQ